MGFTWGNAAKLIVASLVGLAASLPHSSTNVANYKPEDIITRDVCIIGGGSTGTYSAVRLGDFNKSVVVVEMKGRLGGHTETYIDPATQIPIDYGVEIFHNLSIVTDYFARFNIPLTTDIFPSLPQQWVDFRTGKLVTGYEEANATALEEALTAYTAQLLKYPGLNTGFYLPDPVPEDLLMPFGDFVKKYSLEAAVYTIFQLSQSMGNIYNTPTLYVMKVIGLDLLRNLESGFLTTAHHDNSELYQKAQAALSTDLLLNSTVIVMDRDDVGGGVKIEVDTPAGRKLIQAKKLLITIPPKLDNLYGFDLSDTERDLFGQFSNVGFWTALLRHDGVSDDLAINNIGADQPYNLPVLPGIFAIEPTGVPGLHSVKYGAPHTLSNEDVQDAILASIDRLGDAGTDPTTTPEFAVFSSHTPYGLTVDSDAIKAGFYTKLYALQGQRSTFYTGAAWNAHDSSMLWVFTEQLLPAIAA
jgi:hypothetical protein